MSSLFVCQVFWVHHQAPSWPQICVPRLCVRGVYQAACRVRRVSHRLPPGSSYVQGSQTKWAEGKGALIVDGYWWCQHVSQRSGDGLPFPERWAVFQNDVSPSVLTRILVLPLTGRQPARALLGNRSTIMLGRFKVLFAAHLSFLWISLFSRVVYFSWAVHDEVKQTNAWII